MATELYNVNENWIKLSRDILSIPRHWLVDFNSASNPDHHWLLSTLIGWGMLLTVMAVTALPAIRRRDQARAATGYPAAFLLMGGWLTCFHFMYYDILLTALPMFLLLTEPQRYLERAFVAIVPLTEPFLGKRLADYYQLRPARAYPMPMPLVPSPLPLSPATGERGWGEGLGNVWVWNRMAPSMIVVLIIIEFAITPLTLNMPPAWAVPWDTFCIIVLWLWCGWRWRRKKG